MTAANSMPTHSHPAMYTSNATENSLNFTLASNSQNHSLFAQLRSRYPSGGLISELVQVHEGQFVVRVLVQVGNTTLATGMAAADKIEVAEDRARVRAMEVLGISPSTLSPTFEVQARLMTEPSMTDPSKEQEGSVNSFESLTESPSLETPLSETPMPQIEEKALEPITKAKTSRKKKDEPAAVSPSKDDLLSFPGLEMPEAMPEPPSFEIEYPGESAEELSPQLETKLETVNLEKESAPSIEPIDLSDAIAQIGTEIERIGWTKKQGSTYLQETYSKKTRAELTEEELLEFLHYLKALPSKGHPSLSQIPF